MASLEVSRSTVCRAFTRMNSTRKRREIRYRRQRVLEGRVEGDGCRGAGPQRTQRRLVFVAECDVHTSLAPVYGYRPKGEQLRLSVSRNRDPNTTLLASMSLERMGPSMAVKARPRRRSSKPI